MKKIKKIIEKIKNKSIIKIIKNSHNKILRLSYWLKILEQKKILK